MLTESRLAGEGAVNTHQLTGWFTAELFWLGFCFLTTLLIIISASTEQLFFNMLDLL
jgi:hypothetical protein